MDAALDPVTAAPAIVGTAGQAWPVDLDAAAAVRSVGREDVACLAAWVVEASWAHPAWHSYGVTVCHLRPGPNLPAPVVWRAGATHEVVVYALNPRAPRQAMIEGRTWSPLMPANFAGQIVEAEDGAAIARVEAAVRDICAGRLSPDTDFRQAWIARFGSSMLAD